MFNADIASRSQVYPLAEAFRRMAFRIDGLIRSHQDLSNAMSCILQNRELRQALGRAAAQWARENFDVSAMVQAYEEMYENLLDPAHRLEAESVVRRQSTSLRRA